VSKSDSLIKEIVDERNRQYNLPGSEWDMKNSPNDWIAIAGHYLHESSKRKGQNPNLTEWHDSMVKAAAVILAALEHEAIMNDNNQLD